MSLEPYHPVDADEAEELIAKGVKVIDVRQPYEYGYDHIDQALLVSIDGLYSFSQALNQINLSKDEPLIFVCEMGQRSTAACEVAAIAGYTNIYNLSGGMNMWRYSGKMVVKGKK